MWWPRQLIEFHGFLSGRSMIHQSATCHRSVTACPGHLTASNCLVVMLSCPNRNQLLMESHMTRLERSIHWVNEFKKNQAKQENKKQTTTHKSCLLITISRCVWKRKLCCTLERQCHNILHKSLLLVWIDTRNEWMKWKTIQTLPHKHGVHTYMSLFETRRDPWDSYIDVGWAF